MNAIKLYITELKLQAKRQQQQMEESQNKLFLRTEKLSLLIGTIVGQMSQLLNYMKSEDAKLDMSYKSLLDIHQMAALQINSIYYKEQNK